MTTGCYSKFFSEDVLPSCNNARGLSWYDDMNKWLDSRTAVPLSTKCPVDIKKHVVKKKMQNFGCQPLGGVFFMVFMLGESLRSDRKWEVGRGGLEDLHASHTCAEVMPSERGTLQPINGVLCGVCRIHVRVRM